MRAREAASEGLDGELSEIEAVRLDVHLRGCADCREFAASITAMTTELRAAPLERPVAITFEPRRHHVRALRIHGVAAAAAVLVAGSVILGQLVRGAAPASPKPSAASVVQTRMTSVERWEEMLSLLPPADRQRIDLHSTRWAA